MTKRLYDLTPGTIVCRNTGIIVLTSEYNSYHNWYTYNDIEFDDDHEDGIEVDNGGRVTPSDLIGGEI